MRQSLYVALILALSSSAQASLIYSLTEIGNFTPSAINNAGQVVGNGAYWSEEHGLLTVSGANFFDINDSGFAVGSRQSGAIRWSRDTGVQQMAPIHGQLTFGIATSINEHGDAVGIVGFPELGPTETATAGFLWKADGAVEFIGDFSYFSANQINDSGVVAGTYILPTSQQAALWDPVSGFTDIPLASAGANGALWINNVGQVLVMDQDVPYLWSKDEELVPVLVSFSNLSKRLNNHGQVVGRIGSIAHLWSEELGMLNLHTVLDESGTGWHLREAYTINDLGQIAGVGTNPLGQTRAFLLNPVAVPEASTLILTSCGVVAGAAFLRRRKT